MRSMHKLLEAQEKANAEQAAELTRGDSPEAVAAEIETLSDRPESVPKEVWDLIQETGRLATEKLHELLSSVRFSRLRTADQIKLINMAQDRAYGKPKTLRDTGAANKRLGSGDVTASELANMASRALLPEYRSSLTRDDAEDAEVEYDTGDYTGESG